MKTKFTFSSFVLVCFLILFTKTANGQVYAANWKSGTKFLDSLGIYGTPGVASPFNKPGGRYGASTWKSASGDLWLFGGAGFDHAGNYGYLNDLWKYNPQTNQWTFMKGDSTANGTGVYGTLGVTSTQNKPGGRGFCGSWVDQNGNFWLFGGGGFDAANALGPLNDLWMYSPLTSQWTWKGGSNFSYDLGVYGQLGVASTANIPSSRFGSLCWEDLSGNFWLFGGCGTNANGSGDFSDLWKFSPSTGQWVWVKGSANIDVPGNYGTMGNASSSNEPGARYVSTGWRDTFGNLWLFGGLGYSAMGGFEDGLNDLWKYNISTNQWTWVNGGSGLLQPGVYGTQNVTATGNYPGARYGSCGWSDANGNFYLFAGRAIDLTATSIVSHNDLWKYSPSTNLWTWLKGPNTGQNAGNYGTKGVPSVTNMPSARVFAHVWKSSSNTAWVFGGNGVDSSQIVGKKNDLWLLETCAAPLLTVSPSSSLVCSGSSVNLQVTGASSYVWSTQQTGSLVTVSPSVTSSYLVIGTSTAGCSNAITYTQVITPVTNLTVSPVSQTVCAGSAVTATASGANAYLWSNGNTNAVTTITSNVPGTITTTCYPISAVDCVMPATSSVYFLALPSLSVSSSQTSICAGQSAILNVTGAISYTWNTTPIITGQILAITPSTTTTYMVSGINTNGCVATLAYQQIVQDCSSLSDISLSKQVELFPNPSSGALFINIKGIPSETTLLLYNALGQVILHHNFREGQHQVNLDLPKGVYVYRILNNQREIKNGKLLME